MILYFKIILEALKLLTDEKLVDVMFNRNISICVAIKVSFLCFKFKMVKNIFKNYMLFIALVLLF